MAVRARLADAEDARALLRQDPLLDQIVDRAAGAERRIELQQRLRPEALAVEVVVDEPLDPLVPDLDEAARVALVVVDQAFPQVEYVHRKSSRPLASGPIGSSGREAGVCSRRFFRPGRRFRGRSAPGTRR